MNTKELMSFEIAAEDTAKVVGNFYDRCMKISDEDANKIQECIKTLSKEDISILFINQFESIKRCVGQLDQLLTSMINNEPLE